MIVKKMPILQGFPSFEAVKKLSETVLDFSEFNPIFYDIETTGLSHSSSFLYLIGAICYENENWQFYQWFGENSSEEAQILEAFFDFLSNFTCTIQYNGNRFDQPYLEKKYASYHLENPFAHLNSLDLYRELKILQPLLKLPRMKQPDLETFLELPGRTWCDGGECIRHYKTYCKTRESSLSDIILGHNQEDMMGLGKIFSMLSYLALYRGDYNPAHMEITEGKLLAVLELPTPVPTQFSNGCQDFYIQGEQNQVRLLIPMKNGCLKQYYPNYKDYDYIPGEDTAIPKSLSAYMDKSLRIPARRETCYTWFSCSESFLSDKKKQHSYLTHTLPFYLDALKQ